MNAHRILPCTGNLRVHTALLGITAVLAAFAAPAAPDGNWKSGNEAYEKVCARCHQAGVGPELRGRKLPAAYIKVIARNGFRAMPSMPASALDEATLDQIAALIEASPAPAGAAAAAAPTARSPRYPQR